MYCFQKQKGINADEYQQDIAARNENKVLEEEIARLRKENKRQQNEILTLRNVNVSLCVHHCRALMKTKYTFVYFSYCSEIGNSSTRRKEAK